MGLSINTPGAVKIFDFNITAADMLNLGHVADINITAQGEIETVYTGSGGSNGGSNVIIQEYTGVDYINYIYKVTSKLKQATLGALSSADITLTQALNFENSLAFYESSTSGGNSILTSGLFYFTNEVLSSLNSDDFYVLSVTGGNDIDANDDGVADVAPTLNLGSIHAVVDEKTLKNENFKVNILTEVAFQLTKELMLTDLNTTLLQEKLDDIATRLLKEDVNEDEKIDYKDILAFQPMHDKSKLLKAYDEFYEPVVQKIYKNLDIYDDAYALAYGKYFGNTTFQVDENATVGTIIGKVQLYLSDGNVSFHSGARNSDIFDISLDGVVSLKASNLDYEKNTEYLFDITAEVNGEYFDANLSISVNNIVELPILGDYSASIKENISALATVGEIPIFSSDGIYEIILEGDGSELFNVNTSGVISIAENATFNYDVKNIYTLSAYALNSLGESQRVTVTISLQKTNQIIGSVDTPQRAYDVSISADGTKAYVADGTSGLQIIDISNPVAPTIIGAIDTPGRALSVVSSADGTKAYVTDGTSGLQIIDISNPVAPTILGSISTSGYAYDVHISPDGLKAYVADGWSGVQIIDISNPVTPTIIGSISTPGDANAICLSTDGTKAYVADNYEGLQIIEW